MAKKLVMDDLRFPWVYSPVLVSDFAKLVLVYYIIKFQDKKKILKKNIKTKNYCRNVDMIIVMEDPKGISPSQRVTVANLANLEMSCADTAQR